MTLVRREMKLQQRDAVVADSATPTRTRRFIASNEAVDSYNTVIKATGWELERFAANPVILFGHQGRQLPIGKGRAWVEGTELLLDVEFFDAETNPLAEQVLRILDQGVMGASVGFEPLEWTYNEARETGDEWLDMWNPPLDYTRTRLLEVSVVTIPANPEALPVGRDVIQKRLMERIAKRTPPPASQPPLVTGPTAEEVAALIERIVREHRAEQHAADLRRRGSTSRS